MVSKTFFKELVLSEFKFFDHVIIHIFLTCTYYDYRQQSLDASCHQ